jgi:hypothetical protein
MASTPSEGYNPCLLSQAALDEKFGINPGLQNSDVGMLRALVAPVNTGGRIFNPLPDRALPTADGKVKITASILPFICDESSIAEVGNCDTDPGATPEYVYEDFYIDSVTTQRWSIKDSDFRSMCESAGTQFNDMFIRNADAFLRKVNRKSIVQAAAYMGNYPGTSVNSFTDPISLKVVNPAFLANPQVMAFVKSLYMKMQLGMIEPITVGAGSLDLAIAARGVIAGTNDQGVNPASAFGLTNYFRDSQIDSVLANSLAEPLYTWAPGALQLLTWNKNIGPEAYSVPLNREGSYDGIPATTTAYEKQFTTLSIGGLLVDFFYIYDCNGNHTFTLQLHHSVVGLPSSAFAECQDFNYALAFEQACGELSCDDLQIPAEEA